MRYASQEVMGFKKDSQDSAEYCKNLLDNWICTGHIPKPKTYQTLLKYIRKIDKLTTAIWNSWERANKQWYILLTSCLTVFNIITALLNKLAII